MVSSPCMSGGVDPAYRAAIARGVPRPPGAKKLVGRQLDWRIRVGNYRILYEVDDEASIITVWRIAHRREVYR